MTLSPDRRPAVEFALIITGDPGCYSWYFFYLEWTNDVTCGGFNDIRIVSDGWIISSCYVFCVIYALFSKTMMCAAAAAAAACGGILPSSSPSMGLGVRVIYGVGADLSTIGSGMGSCPTPGAQSDCRTRYQLLLSGRALAERYRRIYTTAINDKEQGINQGR